MKKLRWLAVLMGVTILAITGFQLFWLWQNYDREKRSLNIKTAAIFREAIAQVQAGKLKMDMLHDTLSGKKATVLYTKKGFEATAPSPQIISSINMIRDKMRDSPAPGAPMEGKVVISMEQTSLVTRGADSIHIKGKIPSPDMRGNYIINFLYNMDSMQGPIRTEEIDSAFKKGLQKEEITIPYAIVEKDSAAVSAKQSFDEAEVTVGIANPVTYKLQKGNTVPYLLKQIAQPILFSVLLLGITLLSFLLLYKNLVRQQRLTHIKNELISNITHELKTPIATVGVAIEALKSFSAIDSPERTKEYLAISQNELQRLSLLVDKVLTLSLFEKKDIELKYEPVNLEELVNEVVSSLKLQFEKNNASVTVTPKGNLSLHADRLHLISVIYNLLDNALKYSPDNPTINIELEEKSDSIEMKVADNGIGIPQEYAGKIFEKFFRVPQGDTHNVKGYGLGLSYVAQVIEKHSGSIAMNSEQGGGTTFIITLPKQIA